MLWSNVELWLTTLLFNCWLLLSRRGRVVPDMGELGGSLRSRFILMYRLQVLGLKLAEIRYFLLAGCIFFLAGRGIATKTTLNMAQIVCVFPCRHATLFEQQDLA